jgi:hypothetical protein
MTPEKINQAIAEEMGWTKIGFYEDDAGPPFWHGIPPATIGLKGGEWAAKIEEHSKHLPNYFADLNACREMRQTVNEDERGHYCSLLDATIRQRQTGAGEWDLLDATAPDHCQTFLRLKGKWVE